MRGGFKAIYVVIIGIVLLLGVAAYWYTQQYKPLQQQIAQATTTVSDYQKAINAQPQSEKDLAKAKAELKVVRAAFERIRHAKFAPIDASTPQYAAIGLQHECLETIPLLFDRWQQRLGKDATVGIPNSVELGGVNPGHWPATVSFASPSLGSELLEVKASVGGSSGGGNSAGGMPGMMGGMPGMSGGMPGMGGARGGGASTINLTGPALTIKGTYQDAMKVLGTAGDKFDRLITFDRISIQANGPDVQSLVRVLAGYPANPRNTSDVTITVPEATVYYLVEGAAAPAAAAGGGGMPGMGGAMPGMPGMGGAIPGMPGMNGGGPSGATAKKGK